MRRLAFAFMLVVAIVAGWRSEAGQQTGADEHHRHDTSQQGDRDRDRWMWQLPEQVLNAIGVRPGMTVADVGAGNGYFTLRLARRVGDAGIVYANDIDEVALGQIVRRCEAEGVKNVTTIVGLEDDPKLPGSMIDLALLVNVFHLLDNPDRLLGNIRPSLKAGGTLVLVQWDADKLASETPDMPESEHVLFSGDRLVKQLDESGYDIVQVETFLPLQNIYICRPKP